MSSSFLEMHRRNHRSWPAIIDRMSPDNRPAWSLPTTAQPERPVSISINSPWAAFRDAGVLMEMADYAERNGSSFDPGRLQAIRVTAIQLRFAAAGAIIMHARFR
jgi:hypothetical protein